MRRRLPAIVLACFGAASCSAPAPRPTPTPPVARPAPAPITTPAPAPRFDNWMDAPQTPGDWYYRRDANGTRALFGEANTQARFAITCLSAQHRVTLAHAGSAAAAAPMTIRTETTDRTLTANPSGGDQPSLIATLGANDPLLDAIAFSKGRFAVAVPGHPMLYLPSWPEITRVIEDCRS